MAWTYGGVDIKVEKDSGDLVVPRIDEIQVLTSIQTTAINYSGTEGYQRKITAVLFSNFESFQDLVDGTIHELVSDYSSQGNYIILSYTAKRIQDFSQCDAVHAVRVDMILLRIIA